MTQKLRLAPFILDGRKLDSNDLVVARTLLMIAQSYVPRGDGPVILSVTIQQQEVADMLGMSRQTVSQALQRLKAKGIKGKMRFQNVQSALEIRKPTDTSGDVGSVQQASF